MRAKHPTFVLNPDAQYFKINYEVGGSNFFYVMLFIVNVIYTK